MYLLQVYRRCPALWHRLYGEFKWGGGGTGIMEGEGKTVPLTHRCYHSQCSSVQQICIKFPPRSKERAQKWGFCWGWGLEGHHRYNLAPKELTALQSYRRGTRQCQCHREKNRLPWQRCEGPLWQARQVSEGCQEEANLNWDLKNELSCQG